MEPQTHSRAITRQFPCPYVTFDNPNCNKLNQTWNSHHKRRFKYTHQEPTRDNVVNENEARISDFTSSSMLEAGDKIMYPSPSCLQQKSGHVFSLMKSRKYEACLRVCRTLANHFSTNLKSTIGIQNLKVNSHAREKLSRSFPKMQKHVPHGDGNSMVVPQYFQFHTQVINNGHQMSFPVCKVIHDDELISSCGVERRPTQFAEKTSYARSQFRFGLIPQSTSDDVDFPQSSYLASDELNYVSSRIFPRRFNDDLQSRRCCPNSEIQFSQARAMNQAVHDVSSLKLKKSNKKFCSSNIYKVAPEGDSNVMPTLRMDDPQTTLQVDDKFLRHLFGTDYDITTRNYRRFNDKINDVLNFNIGDLLLIGQDDGVTSSVKSSVADDGDDMLAVRYQHALDSLQQKICEWKAIVEVNRT